MKNTCFVSSWSQVAVDGSPTSMIGERSFSMKKKTELKSDSKTI